MSYTDQLKLLVKSFSGQANYIVIPRVFVDLLGDLQVAALLSQALYWSDRAVRRDGYVYKSLSDWQSEIGGVSDYAVRKFKQLPYVKTKVLRANNVPVTHYLIDKELLNQMIIEMLSSQGEPTVTDLEFIEQYDTAAAEVNFSKTTSVSPVDFAESSVDFNESSVDFDGSSVDFNESLTENTTEPKTNTTTDRKKNISKKSNNVNSGDPIRNSKAQKTKPTEKNSPADPVTSKYPNYHAFIKELSDITGFDLAIKNNASRLGKAAVQLLDAGYGVDDLSSFYTYWTERDWRWQKTQSLPTPEIVLSDIARVKKIQDHAYNERQKYNRWLK